MAKRTFETQDMPFPVILIATSAFPDLNAWINLATTRARKGVDEKWGNHAGNADVKRG
jgi:hypothetical protein